MKNTDRAERNSTPLRANENASVVINAEIFFERRKEEEYKKALKKVLSRAAKSDW